MLVYMRDGGKWERERVCVRIGYWQMQGDVVVVDSKIWQLLFCLFHRNDHRECSCVMGEKVSGSDGTASCFCGG